MEKFLFSMTGYNDKFVIIGVVILALFILSLVKKITVLAKVSAILAISFALMYLGTANYKENFGVTIHDKTVVVDNKYTEHLEFYLLDARKVSWKESPSDKSKIEITVLLKDGESVSFAVDSNYKQFADYAVNHILVKDNTID